MSWLLANLFIFCVVVIGGALLYAVGALLWFFNLPPDAHPFLLSVGSVAAILATYYLTKALYTRMNL